MKQQSQQHLASEQMAAWQSYSSVKSDNSYEISDTLVFDISIMQDSLVVSNWTTKRLYCQRLWQEHLSGH